MKVAEKKRRNYLRREVARELHEDDPYLKTGHSSAVHAILFTSLRKVRHYLRRLLRKSQLLSSVMFKSRIRNFTQVNF
jgi:hypothetical protein